jgi:hypothetical protein
MWYVYEGHNLPSGFTSAFLPSPFEILNYANFEQNKLSHGMLSTNSAPVNVLRFHLEQRSICAKKGSTPRAHLSGDKQVSTAKILPHTFHNPARQRRRTDTAVCGT